MYALALEGLGHYELEAAAIPLAKAGEQSLWLGGGGRRPLFGFLSHRQTRHTSNTMQPVSSNSRVFK